MGFTDFSNFTARLGPKPGELTLTSPQMTIPVDWDELVASWNTTTGVYFKVEARAVYPGFATKYFSLGSWSDNPAKHPRESMKGQDTPDAAVLTDTLVLAHPGAKAEVRVSIGGGDLKAPARLKFLGLSFCSSTAQPESSVPDLSARGKTLEVPERVQSGYDGPGGWCSPASVSMVLGYWSAKLGRPDLDRSVPDVATGVNDRVYGGTGNWSFNTAYAGSLPGMRAYVTRLDDIAEVEDWLKAGVPVVLSVSSYLTTGRDTGQDNGHLIVCVGFTEQGDVVVNDPGVSARSGERPRRTYPREKVVSAWKKSKNAVYLIYPESLAIPHSPLNHWDDHRAAR